MSNKYALVNQTTNIVDNTIMLEDRLVGVIPFPGYGVVKLTGIYDDVGIGWIRTPDGFIPPPDLGPEDAGEPEPEGET